VERGEEGHVRRNVGRGEEREVRIEAFIDDVIVTRA
jgi:hypothetical protein